MWYRLLLFLPLGFTQTDGQLQVCLLLDQPLPPRLLQLRAVLGGPRQLLVLLPRRRRRNPAAGAEGGAPDGGEQRHGLPSVRGGSAKSRVRPKRVFLLGVRFGVGVLVAVVENYVERVFVPVVPERVVGEVQASGGGGLRSVCR